MASRALAAAAHGPRGLPRRLRPPAAPGRRAGRSCTGWARCSTRRWRATGARRDLDAATDDVPGGHRRPPGQGRRHQDLAARRPARDRLRRRLPQGVRCYTGDDFNYPELIAGDEQRLQPRAARHLRPARPAGGGRRPRRWTRGTSTASRDPRPDRRALPPPLPGAHPLLQDGRGLPGLAGRPPGALHDGRRPAVGPLPPAPRARLRTRRRGWACSPTRSWPSRADEEPARCHGVTR